MFLVSIVTILFSSILVIGDSNTRHLKEDIYYDSLQSKYQIYVLAMSGMRSNKLGPCVSLAARQYNTVVVAVGNNDLADFSNIPAKPPKEVALNLASFANCTAQDGSQIFVIGLWKRRDMCTVAVETVNTMLHDVLGKNYVAPKLKPKHFKLSDPCHLTNDGKLDFLALLNRLICTRVFK